MKSTLSKLVMVWVLLISPLAVAESPLKINEATEQHKKAYDEYFIQNHEKHIQQVADLVAFPTLAMAPEHAPDLKKAGEYLIKQLSDIGMKKATYHPAEGFPFVTAEWMEAKGQPTVIFYGHFDVQPVDKSRWDSDPFKADIRDKKMYGREGQRTIRATSLP